MLIESFTSLKRIPTLPDGGSSVIYFIEPAWVLALQQQVVGEVVHSVLSKGRTQIGCADETCGETISVADNLLTQFFLGVLVIHFLVEHIEMEGKHVGCLSLEGEMMTYHIAFAELLTDGSCKGIVLVGFFFLTQDDADTSHEVGYIGIIAY